MYPATLPSLPLFPCMIVTVIVCTLYITSHHAFMHTASVVVVVVVEVVVVVVVV